jgi:S-(hydroxymethyl)glutathione dehydrogenase/alcohol dehydrogenase
MVPRTFKAAFLEHINGDLTLDNLEFPDLQKGQVLVKVIYTSICASQLFEIAGERGEDPYLPHLLGHEGYGEVIRIGEGVERFTQGDKVILTWIKQAGIECDPISFRTSANKLINAGRVTTFSEFTVVSENRLFLAPTTTKEETLPLLGCAALTGAGMVYGHLEELDKVLVVGAGGVGLFSILALLDSGIERIEVIEKSKSRANQLKNLSSRIKVYSSFTDDTFSREIESNGNFSLIFEASGSISALQTSIEFMTKKGKLVFASHPIKGKKICVDPYELIQGKVIRGSWGGGCEDFGSLRKVIDLFVRKANTISEFISSPYPLSNINKALEVAKNSGDKKIVIGMLE